MSGFYGEYFQNPWLLLLTQSFTDFACFVSGTCEYKTSETLKTTKNRKQQAVNLSFDPLCVHSSTLAISLSSIHHHFPNCKCVCVCMNSHECYIDLSSSGGDSKTPPCSSPATACRNTSQTETQSDTANRGNTKGHSNLKHT